MDKTLILILAQILQPIFAPQPSSVQAWAFIQACSGGTAAASPVTCVFTSNVTTANSVICFLNVDNTTSTISSINLSGSSPTTLTNRQNAVGTSNQAWSYDALSANSGSTKTVTATFNNTPSASIECGEYSGITTHTAANNQGTGSSTALDSGTFNTDANNSLCVGGGGIIVASGTFTQGTGFTIRAQRSGTGGSNTAGLIEDKNVASSGTACDATATASGTGNWSMIAEAYH